MGRGQGWRAGERRYLPEELQEEIDGYFARCEEQGRKPTMPGLCYHLRVHTDTFKRWAEDKRGTQGTCAWVAKGALMRLSDTLQQRVDVMAMFLLKQPCYGGYTDRPADGGDGQLKISVDFGKGAGKVALDYGK